MTEIRTGKASPVEFRKAPEGSASPGTLAGYALKFMVLSRDLGGFVEQVAPEAVTKSLADQVRVMARYNHDDNHLLGTTDSGTLRLSADDVGLPYEIDLPGTTAGRDVAVMAELGLVRYSSFSFVVPQGGDEWGFTSQDYPLRTIRAMQLVDVAPVNDPAYWDTSAAMRSLSDVIGRDASQVPVADLRVLLTSSLSGEEARADEGQGETHPALLARQVRLRALGLTL